MRRLLLFLATSAILVGAAAHAAVVPEVRPFAGVFIPTGDQRDVLKRSALVGGQVAVEMNDMFHLVGTLAYTTPRPERPTIGKDVHVYQYDVGAEAFRSVPFRKTWQFRPFLGTGIGARTHDFFDRNDVKAQTYLAGYGAAGTELQVGRTAARLEVRDYVTRFKGLLGSDHAKARNDIMMSLGLAYHFH